ALGSCALCLLPAACCLSRALCLVPCACRLPTRNSPAERMLAGACIPIESRGLPGCAIASPVGLRQRRSPCVQSQFVTGSPPSERAHPAVTGLHRPVAGLLPSGPSS